MQNIYFLPFVGVHRRVLAADILLASWLGFEMHS